MSQQEKHSLLLVDDEPEILFSLRGLLRRDFELFSAQSGKEALAILERHPIQVIMTDQRMPEMTGVQLINQVRARFPHAIRIIFTGYSDIRAVVEAINNGGLFRYLTKPWDPDELMNVLHQATEKYDEYAAQARLLEDLRVHFVKGSELAGEDSAASAETRQFVQASVGFLERLQQLKESEKELAPTE